jgi:hypothetical protein
MGAWPKQAEAADLDSAGCGFSEAAHRPHVKSPGWGNGSPAVAPLDPQMQVRFLRPGLCRMLDTSFNFTVMGFFPRCGGALP